MKHDSPTAEVMEGTHHRARASRLGNARDAARPAIADAGDRSLVKRFRAGGVLELSNAADPGEKLGLIVLDASTQVRELEVRVAIDEAGQQLRVGEMQGLRVSRLRHLRIRSDRRDPAVCINKNGAVLVRRRRNWIDNARANSQSHEAQATRHKKSCADGEVASGSKLREKKRPGRLSWPLGLGAWSHFAVCATSQLRE